MLHTFREVLKTHHWRWEQAWGIHVQTRTVDWLRARIVSRKDRNGKGGILLRGFGMPGAEFPSPLLTRLNHYHRPADSSCIIWNLDRLSTPADECDPPVSTILHSFEM